MSTSDKLDVVKIVVAVLGAIPALSVYYNNSRLRRAEWLASLYEKFYERADLKDIRETLDCEGGQSAGIDNLVNEESAGFTDYLNFFEFVAVLRKSNQLTNEQIEDLFGYYLDCLESCQAVRTYVAKKGYEQLDRTAARTRATEMREYLFAYGTLADDTPQEIAATVKQLKFVGEGFIFGRLYDVGEYPGAVLDDTRRSKVFGKIFEIGADPSLLQRLDKYEGFNRRRPAKSLFVRKRIVINRPNKAPLTGWVYEYNRDLKSTPVIKTGRYSKVSV